MPHGPAIRIIETNRPDVLGFEIDGKISGAEMKAVASYFNGCAEARSAGLAMARGLAGRGAGDRRLIGAVLTAAVNR